MVAALKTLLGATLIWVVARTALTVNPLLTGWLGMVGLIFVLHFGQYTSMWYNSLKLMDISFSLMWCQLLQVAHP